VVTPAEFARAGAVERFLDLLHDPRPVEPATGAPYYGARNYAGLIARGVLVLVNAVAYRSRSISRELDNREVAGLLPSTAVHRKWLRSELLPQAMAGKRLVIAHRTSLWGLRRREIASPNVLFTTNPVSADLSRDALKAISEYR
jgi:hypothetical protein